MPKEPWKNSTLRILILEDDGYCRHFLTEILGINASQIMVREYGSDILEILQEQELDVVIISIRSQDDRDLTLIRLLVDVNARVPVISVAQHPTADFAMNVLRAGAFDCIEKPFNNIARIEKAINSACLKRDNARKITDYSREALDKYGLISKSNKLNEICKLISSVAPLDVTVLISGESGTGKELIARAIHQQSERKSRPFVGLNCGAFPEGLVESLLFGHEKGAFTSAVSTHSGFVEQAEGGTLFLDDVSELNYKAQVALLRFLQERVFTKVGGKQEIVSDVRIIASTNVNLEEEVALKNFREDLYYRLNVVNLGVPPLRERQEDILYLIDYFMKRFCLKNNRPLQRLSVKACQILEQYPWPGNVRELENFTEGLLATTRADKEVISANDLVSYSGKINKTSQESNIVDIEQVSSLSYKEGMSNLEKSYLEAVLSKHQGNVAKAAKALGIHHVTLHRKLQKLGIEK